MKKNIKINECENCQSTNLRYEGSYKICNGCGRIMNNDK